MTDPPGTMTPDPEHDPDVRVFFIGFNKTATNALVVPFAEAGYPALHWGGDAAQSNAAWIMARNVALARPILKGLERYRVFSDLTYCTHDTYIEAARFFPRLHREHPRSYFILNTRDEEAWIVSRLRHRDGDFARRAGSALRLPQKELIQAWRHQRAQHHREVRDYFASSPARFLEFDIDLDSFQAVVDLVAPDFAISAEHWRLVNETAPPPLIGVRARAARQLRRRFGR